MGLGLAGFRRGGAPTRPLRSRPEEVAEEEEAEEEKEAAAAAAAAGGSVPPAAQRRSIPLAALSSPSAEAHRRSSALALASAAW